MVDSEPRKAVVLLSGGLDSATVLAMARRDGFASYCISVRYGQRHSVELEAAARIAKQFDAVQHRIVDVDLSAIGGSALTDSSIPVPEEPTTGIPVTYVPARNTVFLSLALAYAEVIGATDLFMGVNAVDYSGYPDCRPAFIHAFAELANFATRAGVEGAEFVVHTPLIDLTKAQIIRAGTKLGVDYGLTVSCYQADSEGRACGVCDSCRIRQAGFAAAELPDVTRYV